MFPGNVYGLGGMDLLAPPLKYALANYYGDKASESWQKINAYFLFIYNVPHPEMGELVQIP